MVQITDGDRRDAELIAESLKNAGFVGELYDIPSHGDVARRVKPVLLRLLQETTSLLQKNELVDAASRIRGINAKPFIEELRRLAPLLESVPPRESTADLSKEEWMSLLQRVASSPFSPHSLGWNLGEAIRQTSTPSDFDDVKQLLGERRLGQARQMLPYVFTKAKGPARKDAAEYLVQFLDDEDLVLQVIDALATLKAVNAVRAIRKFETSSNKYVRRAVQKALTQIGRSSRTRPALPLAPPVSTGEEISWSCDVIQLPELLEQLGAFVPDAQARVEDIVAEIDLMEVDDERTFRFHTGDGSHRPVDLYVFKDDDEAIDVSVFVPADLKDAIRRHLTVLDQ